MSSDLDLSIASEFVPLNYDDILQSALDASRNVSKSSVVIESPSELEARLAQRGATSTRWKLDTGLHLHSTAIITDGCGQTAYNVTAEGIFVEMTATDASSKRRAFTTKQVFAFSMLPRYRVTLDQLQATVSFSSKWCKVYADITFDDGSPAIIFRCNRNGTQYIISRGDSVITTGTRSCCHYDYEIATGENVELIHGVLLGFDKILLHEKHRT